MPLMNQAELMKEETMSCTKKEYSAESIPLILHQVDIYVIIFVRYTYCEIHTRPAEIYLKRGAEISADISSRFFRSICDKFVSMLIHKY